MFTPAQYDTIDPACVLIDLASAPGGIDASQCLRRSLQFTHARGLPGKTAPATAGRLIAQTVARTLTEQEALLNETLTLGYALCGSFCTFEESLQALEALAARYAHIIPIFSEASATLDTRFGRAAEHIARAEQICGRPALRSLTDATHRPEKTAGPADRRPLHRAILWQNSPVAWRTPP